MRLLTIDSRDRAGRPGVLLDSGQILDLAGAPSTMSEAHWVPQSVVSILAAGESGLERVRDLTEAVTARAAVDDRALLDAGVLLPLATTALLAPIRRPGLILITEPDGGGAFIKSPNTAIGHAANLALPRSARGVTAEIMLAAVIGRALSAASPDDAESAIAAYTVLVDLSCAAPRAVETKADWQAWLAARQFPGACPMGPALITVDSLDAPHAARLAVAVNGVRSCVFSAFPGGVSLPETVARLSASFGLQAGDLIGIRPDDAQATISLNPGDRLAVKLDAEMELSIDLSPGE